MVIGPFQIEPSLRRKARPGESLDDRRILQFSKKEGKDIDEALAKMGCGFAPLMAELALKIAAQVKEGGHEKPKRTAHPKLRPTRRYSVKRGLIFHK
jgi:hypothetical protein